MRNNVTKLNDYKAKQDRGYSKAGAEGEAFFLVVGSGFSALMIFIVILLVR